MNDLLLIRNGTVLDGRPDATPRRADVLVRGDRILRIGNGLRCESAMTLDARGCMVAPGFIDVHAHSDETALLDPSAQGRVHEGVTTELSGNCGYSLFPMAGPGMEERRRALLEQGIEVNWSTAAEYFDRIRSIGTAINRGFFVGHGALRAAVVGEAARPARPRELRRMENLLAESLEQGALGLSSGLIYPPGVFAPTDEIIALCRTTARFGRPYVTHIRGEGRPLLGAIREAIRIARSAAVRLQVSHVKVFGPENWWKFDRLEKILMEARAGGVDLAADRYPYVASSTGLSSVFPAWLMVGGRERALKRLRDPRTRRRLKMEALRLNRRADSWDAVVVASARGAAREFEGLSVAAVAERLNVEPVEAACEILAMSDLDTSAIFFDMSDEHLERIYRWPFVFVGSDSASRSLAGPTAVGRPHPRTFGTFGRFLSEYVMRRRLMPLAEGIARITSLPAQRFGLKDRGLLRPGAYADVTVFVPDEYRDRATYEKPFNLTAGVRHLIVNGQLVIRDGRRTRRLPGRMLQPE